MKVVFDNIIFYLQRSGGGTIYWIELIKQAIEDNSIEVYFSEPRKKLENNFRQNLALQVTFFEKLPLLYLRIANFTIPVTGKFIFHSSYYRISKSKDAINVVTIHDFTSEFFLTGIRRYIHMIRKRKAILNSDGIICISNNTKKDLLKLYPAIDQSKIKVIYNGVSSDYFKIDNSLVSADFKYKNILDQKYILYVGHRTSYKNFFIAAEAISRLGSDFKFIVIGEKLTNVESKSLTLILQDRYICYSGISNDELNIFYNYAFCLIYPSSYEGFGIPVLEAMRAGCPVVTTDRSSIPEVAGDATIQVSNLDPDSFAAAILEYSDQNIRFEKIEKGFIQSSKFSWTKSFEEVKDFYQILFNTKK